MSCRAGRCTHPLLPNKATQALAVLSQACTLLCAAGPMPDQVPSKLKNVYADFRFAQVRLRLRL